MSGIVDGRPGCGQGLSEVLAEFERVSGKRISGDAGFRHLDKEPESEYNEYELKR